MVPLLLPDRLHVVEAVSEAMVYDVAERDEGKHERVECVNFLISRLSVHVPAERLQCLSEDLGLNELLGCSTSLSRDGLDRAAIRFEVDPNDVVCKRRDVWRMCLLCRVRRKRKGQDVIGERARCEGFQEALRTGEREM